MMMMMMNNNNNMMMKKGKEEEASVAPVAPVDPYVCGGPLETRLEARLRVAVDSGAVCAARRRYKAAAGKKTTTMMREPGAVTRTRARLADAVAAGRLAVQRAAGRPAAGVTLRRRGGEAWTLPGAEVDLLAEMLQADQDEWWGV